MRLGANDLTHADSGPVTAGATVTIELYDATGALVASHPGSNGGAGDHWWYDVAAPATPGMYEVRITATVAGATAKSKDRLRVNPF